MKFTKDVAHIIFNLKDGQSYKHTFSIFLLDVDRLANKLMREVNSGEKYIYLDGDATIDSEEVESFEITNYDDLHELKLQREAEEIEKSTK